MKRSTRLLAVRSLVGFGLLVGLDPLAAVPIPIDLTPGVTQLKVQPFLGFTGSLNPPTYSWPLAQFRFFHFGRIFPPPASRVSPPTS